MGEREVLVSEGRLYRYRPIGLDLFMPVAGQPRHGAVVRKVQPVGCPKNGAMGHAYVETADDGPQAGPVLVSESSLRPLTPRESYEAARSRVANDEQLAPFAEFILADWPEGEDHWEWVATAPIAEIIEWVAAAYVEDDPDQEFRDNQQRRVGR